MLLQLTVASNFHEAFIRYFMRTSAHVYKNEVHNYVTFNT